MYKIRVNIKNCKDIKELSDFIERNNIKLILFAETHGYLKEISIQSKIIHNSKPRYFLYEMLEESRILNNEDAKKFLDKKNNGDFSFISSYTDLIPTIRLARKFNLPLIGCDIKNMCCKSKNWINERYPKAYWSKITKKREMQQAKIINHYTPKGLVFVSLGAYHLRKNSITLRKLNEKKFLIVYPLFDGKKNFLIPHDQRRFNVSFSVKLMKKR